MTRNEMLAARQWRAALEGSELPANSVPRPNVVVENPESIRTPNTRRPGWNH
jgi:hypothetical protein